MSATLKACGINLQMISLKKHQRYHDIFVNQYQEINNSVLIVIENRILTMGWQDGPKYELQQTLSDGGNRLTGYVRATSYNPIMLDEYV